jgi:two-component system NtrC family sensor kinase
LSGPTRIEELERQVLAQQKTIDVLMRRVQQSDADGTSGQSLIRHNHELDRIVNERTVELREQREALTNALDLFKALTSNIPDLLLHFGRDRRLVWSNRADFQARTDTPLAELVGTDDPADPLIARVNEALTSNGPTTAFDYANSRGETWSCRVGPVRHRREVIGAVVIARDVTAQLAVEDELRMATAQLLQAQKLSAIGQLAAGVAHEINTPIQFVSDNTVYTSRALERLQPVFDRLLALSSSGALDREDLVPLQTALTECRLPKMRQQLPRALEQSLDGLARVAKIVSAMKEFSHPSHGTKELVDLRATLECTATIARNEWKYVADLEIDVDPTLPRIPLLRDEFNQVILNLIVNASHAIADRYRDSEQRGCIKIGAVVSGEEVVVRVSDDGNGIPEPIRHKVFEPFFTTKPVGQGTGQGLAIAYSVIVDKHRGRIELESEVGRGTTFILHLPATDEGTANARAAG